MKSDFKQVIGIHSNPRSGSTWLAQIFNSHPNVRYKYQPLKSKTFQGRISDHSSKEQVNQFYNEVYNTEDDYLDQNFQKKDKAVPLNFNKNSKPENLVIKMVRFHYLVPFLLDLIEEQKIIGLVRHPCSYLNSWKNAPKEFLPEWSWKDEWYFAQSYNCFRSGEYYGFNRWKEVSFMFLHMEKLYPDRFKLMKYEDLVSDTMNKTEELFNFCGLEMNEQTKSFIEDSQNTEVKNDYSVFRAGKNINSWQNELEPEIIHRVEQELKDTALNVFLK